MTAKEKAKQVASDLASLQKRNTVRLKPDFPLGGWTPSAEPNPFKHCTKDYKGYTIEVKQDFGSDYAMIDGMPCNFGYIVTKDSQNVLPGGGWTPTVADAQLAIDCLIASEGDFSKFHQLFQAVKQASAARGLEVLTGELPLPTEVELAMAAHIQHYKAAPARFCTGTEPQTAGAMYVIRYRADGSFNYGPPNTNVNGFPVRLDEATRYASQDSAQQKAADLGDVEIMTYAEAVAATPPDGHC